MTGKIYHYVAFIFIQADQFDTGIDFFKQMLYKIYLTSRDHLSNE